MEQMSISNHVKDICKIGQKDKCCRYLVASGRGFECAKHTELKDHLDERVLTDSIVAQGDNCEGYDMEKSIRILN